MTSLTIAMTLLIPGPGADPLVELVNQDFRERNETNPVLKWMGPTPEKFMRPEAAGLRITLPEKTPEKKKGSVPVGVTYRVPIHGDFEATLTYEILKIGKPASGYGAGVNFWASMDSPGADVASLAHFIRPQGAELFVTDHGFDDSGGNRKHASVDFPTKARTGKLRLVRSGSTIIYLISNGTDAEFKELRREEFGSDPLRAVCGAADTGGAAVEVDILLVDFQIKAKEQSIMLTQNPITKNSIWADLSIGLAIVGALALAVVSVRRYRRRQIKPDEIGGDGVSIAE